MVCFVWGGKNGMGCFVRGDKNCMGCFVQGGRSMREVLSGVSKNELNLPPLQDRRKANRVTFFFKMVEGLVPAMQSHDFLTPIRGNCHIKSKQYTDCVTSNTIDKQSTNNSTCKCFKIFQCNSETYKNSFFPRTIVDWNHLANNFVRTDTVDSFRKAVHHWD